MHSPVCSVVYHHSHAYRATVCSAGRTTLFTSLAEENSISPLAFPLLLCPRIPSLPLGRAYFPTRLLQSTSPAPRGCYSPPVLPQRGCYRPSLSSFSSRSRCCCCTRGSLPFSPLTYFPFLPPAPRGCYSPPDVYT